MQRAWPLVQLVAIAGVAFGFGMVAIWAGIVVGCFGLLAFGVAGELDAAEARPSRDHGTSTPG